MKKGGRKVKRGGHSMKQGGHTIKQGGLPIKKWPLYQRMSTFRQTRGPALQKTWLLDQNSRRLYQTPL